jgi:UDP-glucose 4-epimerase
MKNLEEFAGEAGFSFHRIDLSEQEKVTELFLTIKRAEPVEEVWHLAANSDIQAGIAEPSVDLNDTFLTTYSLVNAMRSAGVRRLFFASTSAIYGDLGKTVLKEDVGPLLPISNYGAMKLAGEAYISAAVESHLEQAFLFRFPNVIGVPATHGVLLDFARKLKKDPTRLEVLGNGTQQKGYLHVSDLIGAMLHLRNTVTARLSVHNIGAVDEGVSVRQIAEEMAALAAPGAKLEFGTSDKGWVGDVPKFRYSVQKLLDTGWRPSMDSLAAMRRAMREVAAQEGLL